MGKIKRSIGISAVVIVVVAAGIVALAETGGVTPLNKGSNRWIPINANLQVAAVPVSAPAAILMDAKTGQVLYAKNIMQKHYPASLVKLMTSIIALDRVKKGTLTYHSLIPVSQNAYQVAQTPGLSVAYLNPAENITLAKMLEYMYVVSADDAAVAIADDIAGSESTFAIQMNRKATQLGLTGTHYVNASGLQNAKQYTNAYDVAKLSQYLIQKFPIVLQYASEPGMYIHPGQYGNTYDQLLGQYAGLDGLKTGSTDQAGYCFSGTAIRNGHRLISVVMDASSFTNVFQDTKNLLNYGFQQFKQEKIQTAGQALLTPLAVKDAQKQKISVAPKLDVWLNVPRSLGHSIFTSFIPSVTNAPIIKGQQVGMEEIGYQGHVVLTVPVYAQENDPKAGFFVKTWRVVMINAHQGAAKIVNWAIKKLAKL